MLNDARRAAPKGSRHKWEFQCSQCKAWKKQKEVQVDHKVPCGPLNDFSDLPVFVERLYCGKDGLQVLCSTCHNIKTKKERSKIE